MNFTETLIKSYEKSCDDILLEFCKRYDLPYDCECWSTGDIGTIALVADYYIDFQDIIYMLKNNIPFDEWLACYDYNLDAHFLGIHAISFVSWHRGCPRLSKDEIDDLKEKKKELEELCKKYNGKLY